MDSSRNVVLALLVVGIALAVVYMIDPTMFGMVGAKAENFQNMGMMKPTMEAMGRMESMLPSGPNSVSGFKSEMYQNPEDEEEIIKKNAAALEELTKGSMGAMDSMDSMDATEGFQNAPSDAQPANCYPKNQLSPQELLPSDPNSKWAQVNPSGQGDISGKNFLNAGALVGVNTVGQSPA